MKTPIFLFLLIFLVSSYVSGQQNLRRIFQPEDVINKIPYGANPETGKYVQADDAKIYYEIYGSGEPVVILHGGLYGSTIEMGQFIDSLKTNHQVIVISTRGHGKSEIGTKPVTYEQKANDVMAVINKEIMGKVTLLGFSDGAYTGYKIASMYPERIKKLIAIGAGEQTPHLRQVVPMTKEVCKLDTAYWNQQLKLMPEPDRLEKFWLEMAQFYNSMEAGKELLMTIKCPVLVMSGEKDKNAPLSTIVNAYNMIPNSQLSIIPNCGHQVFIENFPAVWTSMLPFLQIQH